ncbi:hypothetical protein [Glutamicibacter sp. V16R2B1]|uniref:hypothetical protein n=1 Tax=Glutamicibacter sp. V16R2B1 TaxID=2036207 RepID=UPI0010FD1EE5|nr:hypothetical protein [Glutamicibacter sp. V16R2B1]TLK48002.1 hypothetical protein FDN03_15415 [Glutamicibacter sp. V16R2B1]
MPADNEETIRRADLRDLVGINQLQDLLGKRRGQRVARNTAIAVANSKGFPDPLIAHPSPDAPQIRLWLRGDVEVWLDANRPGWRDPR